MPLQLESWKYSYSYVLSSTEYVSPPLTYKNSNGRENVWKFMIGDWNKSRRTWMVEICNCCSILIWSAFYSSIVDCLISWIKFAMIRIKFVVSQPFFVYFLPSFLHLLRLFYLVYNFILVCILLIFVITTQLISS